MYWQESGGDKIPHTITIELYIVLNGMEGDWLLSTGHMFVVNITSDNIGLFPNLWYMYLYMIYGK
jgi:hypothetical protein